MGRTAGAAFLALIVVSAAPLAQQKQQPSVAGLWRVEFVTPLGQVGVNMTINQSGTKLSARSPTSTASGRSTAASTAIR